MSAMFRKPKRNFRQRVVQNDSDDDNSMESMETEDSMDSIDARCNDMMPKKSKDKKKKDKSKSVLSFDQEEGDTVFQIKKSSHSKKLAKQLKKESMMEREEEGRNSMKKETGPIQSSVPSVQVKQESKEEMEDRIKKLREEFQTMNGDEAAALDGEDSDEDGTFKKMLKRGEIPDATTIHQIRKQRQMARDMGDFLPLDDTVKYENSSSRLVREDDNDKSDDDEEQRIDFSTNQNALDRQRMKDDFLRAEHGSDDEGSDQEREWEEQQIRKGVAIQQVASNQDLYSYEQENQTGATGNSNGHDNVHTTLEESSTVKPMGNMMKIRSATENITMEMLVKRLKDRLTSMEDVHRAHKLEADKLVQDVKETKDSIKHCEDSVGSLEERFKFFQEMRGYVRDLVDCLNEKVPIINDLETRMNNLLRQRANKFLSRRQQDVQDQCQAYMTNKSQQVVQDAESHARQRRIAEREARRARRRRARETKNISGHHEGLSSDDEENQSEITKYNQERDEIGSTTSELFEDVVEDFSETDCVRERFHDWKRKYGSTYKEAYIGLCLPKLVNPFVRLQLITWNPLQEKCRDLEEMRWYDSMLFYGFEEGEPIDKEDDDVKLLPSIVEKIVLPKLANIAENQWDPLSTSQTCRFVRLVKKLHKDYPTVNGNSKNAQGLLRALVVRMKKTLDDDVFMPLYPKSALENRSSGPSVFLHRQSWTCIKLLGHFLSWHGIISTKILQGLALDGLLNRYILLGLQTASFNQETLLKCQAIVSTFPKEWFEDLEGDKTIPQLENLCRFLSHVAQLLDTAAKTANELQKKDLREQLKQISKLLINIHSLDHVMKLSSLYSLGASSISYR